MAEGLSHAAEHVNDAEVFHVPVFLWQHLPDWMKDIHHPGSVLCPRIDFGGAEPFIITKYMFLELVAAALILAIFVPLAWHIAKGTAPKGKIWNFFEVFLLFIRDEVARPAIGGKEADKFLPFLWTIFFFVLGCNLLGMIPWMGSPTGSIAVTSVLAGATFIAVVSTGMAKFGAVGFWTGLVPHMDLPFAIAIVLWPMLLVIEVAALFIKHIVLAVRLLANMFAGHLVLAVIVGFIAATAKSHIALWIGVTTASVLGSVALSMLELFVAFLQAYIFVFLSSLFIGMAVHQH